MVSRQVDVIKEDSDEQREESSSGLGLSDNEDDKAILDVAGVALQPRLHKKEREQRELLNDLAKQRESYPMIHANATSLLEKVSFDQVLVTEVEQRKHTRHVVTAEKRDKSTPPKTKEE